MTNTLLHNLIGMEKQWKDQLRIRFYDTISHFSTPQLFTVLPQGQSYLLKQLMLLFFFFQNHDLAGSVKQTGLKKKKKDIPNQNNVTATRTGDENDTLIQLHHW